ncbi:MAG: imidazole glycerol phosphate synthase subunit HisH, partial [Nitrospirae bacterium]|nr:imidazole glycerol phosphate synthase subunit HisH [Nitrospirota bacterium]
MIAVIDYGMGNLRSVQKAFEHVGHPAVIAKDPRQVEEASHVVLPGVGGFPECMKNLTHSGMVGALRRSIESGKPFLGICLGLQLLFSESEEFGSHAGLDIVPGKVVRFSGTVFERDPELKVPHMGWNQIRIVRNAPLFDGIPDGSFVYFVHSYHGIPGDREVVSAVTDYGIPFASAIQRGNLYACQFHPEKSQ